MFKPFMAWAGGLATVTLVACAGLPNAQPHPGKPTYDSLCVACHGAGGQGDGPVAGDLPVAPMDLTMLAATNDGVFPRDRVFTQVYGYPGKFHASVMPEFGPLFEGETVKVRAQDGQMVDTPRALVELVDYLETLQQKG